MDQKLVNHAFEFVKDELIKDPNGFGAMVFCSLCMKKPDKAHAVLTKLNEDADLAPIHLRQLMQHLHAGRKDDLPYHVLGEHYDFWVGKIYASDPVDMPVLLAHAERLGRRDSSTPLVRFKNGIRSRRSENKAFFLAERSEIIAQSPQDLKPSELKPIFSYAMQVFDRFPFLRLEYGCRTAQGPAELSDFLTSGLYENSAHGVGVLMPLIVRDVTEVRDDIRMPESVRRFAQYQLSLVYNNLADKWVLPSPGTQETEVRRIGLLDARQADDEHYTRDWPKSLTNIPLKTRIFRAWRMTGLALRQFHAARSYSDY